MVTAPTHKYDIHYKHTSNDLIDAEAVVERSLIEMASVRLRDRLAIISRRSRVTVASAR